MLSTKKSFIALAVTVMASLLAHAQALAPGAAPSSAALINVQPSAAVMGQQIETVEELLQLDSKMALEKAREKAAKLLPPPAPSTLAPVAAPAAQDVIEVLAVMGIGEEKTATISINGRVYSRLAVGATAGGYTLTSVGDGCVNLAKPTAKPRGRRPATKAAPGKKVCFDYQAEREASLEGLAVPSPGLSGISGRGTMTPLPLPTIPAVMPVPGGVPGTH